MLKLTYPSKEFRPSWRKAIDQELEFRVDVKVGRFRKNAVKNWLDYLYHRKVPPTPFAPFTIYLFLELCSCISCAYITNKYSIEHSITKMGLLITFSRRKLPPVRNLLRFNCHGALPIQIRYRSKEFASTWRKAISDRVEFCVDVQIGKYKIIGEYKRNSVKGYIKWIFVNDGEMLRFNLDIYFLDLIRCIHSAYRTEAYAVKYADEKNRILIHFHRI